MIFSLPTERATPLKQLFLKCRMIFLLANMDNKDINMLVLLDLSSAFDTLDHAVLLNHLKYIGITGFVQGLY